MDDYNAGDDGDGACHGENDRDEDASMSLECRMPEFTELLALMASELEMIQRLQDAECPKPWNCMHKWSMRQRPEYATFHNL